LDIGDDIYTSDITSLIYNIEGVKENSVTCTMYEATPLYQIGHSFGYRMWKLDDTKKAPVYVIVYDVANGTVTSSEVTMTFDYYDNEGDKQTNGSITIPINTSLWALNSPTTPSVSNNTRRIENVSATGITDGDKFQFRSRRESSWIVVRTAQKAWAGIINISVS
jgi:hypothetical protein